MKNCENLCTAVIRLAGDYSERDNNFIPQSQLVFNVRKNQHEDAACPEQQAFRIRLRRESPWSSSLGARALPDP
jgi:hypothetical protein